jgi:hypothetical protein
VSDSPITRSVPAHYVGRRLEVRPGATSLTIYDGARTVAEHFRSLLHRTLPAKAVIAGMNAALNLHSCDPDLVAVSAYDLICRSPYDLTCRSVSAC